ncbi:hypothetical protein Moror_15757, partial [Moniliophthora roreri MCA 2997]
MVGIPALQDNPTTSTQSSSYLDWSSFDLRVVRQFDQHVSLPGDSFTLKVYELRAFEWAVTMFRDSPSMIPHLQNVLETIPPSVAVSAVLGRWDRMVWDAVSMEDVEDALRNPYSPFWEPTIRRPVLQQREGINLLFHQQYWVNMAASPSLGGYDLDQLIGSMKLADLQHSTGLRFVIPFSVVDALWSHEDPILRAKSLTLLSLFEESWKPCPGYDEERHNLEQRVFMRALADHINHKDRVSALLTSKRGQAFIRFIHNEAVARRFVSSSLFDPYGLRGIWSQAIKRAQEVGSLPSDYFAPVPGRWKPLPTLPNLDPIRYSVETQRDSQVDNSEVLSIMTSNEHGDAIGANPPEGLIRRLHNFGPWLVAHRWLSFFSGSEKATHNDVNDNAILGGRIADSPVEMIEIASRESGEGHEGNAQHLGRDDNMKDSGPRQRTDTGILSDSSGQGVEVADISGDRHDLRRQGSRADAMGQPTHDQEDMNEDNAHRLGSDT